jgi:hypothetical protein
MNTTTATKPGFNLLRVLKTVYGFTKRPTRPQTDVELVVEIMQHGSFGQLPRLFVMDIVDKHARVTAALTDSEADAITTVLIDGRRWRDMAREVVAKMDNRRRVPYYGDGDEFEL